MKNVSTAVRTVKSVITANSPVLLTAAAFAGVVSTGVLSAKAGWKARGIVDAAQEEQVAPLTTQEKVKLTWLCYTVPAVTGASTIASVLGVHVIHTKRHAALAGLYAVASTKLDDYQEKAEEMLGAKKSQQLRDQVAQKGVDRVPFDDNEVIILDGGTELMYDDWSGRYFMGSVSKVEHAINVLNATLMEDGDVALNDYYELVGLAGIPMGLYFGWSGAKIEAKFGAVNTTNGRAAVSVWFQDAPKQNLGRR